MSDSRACVTVDGNRFTVSVSEGIVFTTIEIYQGHLLGVTRFNPILSRRIRSNVEKTVENMLLDACEEIEEQESESSGIEDQVRRAANRADIVWKSEENE